MALLTVHPPRTTDRLASYLLRAKVPQAALARMLGVSPGMVSHILSGRRTPSLVLASKIERLTGIPARAWAEQVE